MVAARFTALAFAFGLAALPTHAVAPRVAGPPLLCFPLDIGGAATLPFGGDGFDVKSDLSTEEVVAQARAILEKSDDALVHMETLRRTTIWFMSKEEGPGEDRSAHGKRGNSSAAARFRATLSDAVLLAASATGDGEIGRAHV